MDGFDVDELHVKWMNLVCHCCLKRSLGINQANVHRLWRRFYQKGCETKLFIEEWDKDEITGSLGIDKAVLDWLCEGPTVSICAKKRHPRKSGVD
ncbi:MAG: hypothetical protein VXU42_02275 [Verrucomicrobiota bacterium]|nr:hypothetical protein [Verrucomicrobiota bacterium]